MIHALDIPWGFKHPDITYWKDKKIHVYKGALLPPELRRFQAPEFSYHKWQEDEQNGQELPPPPPKNVFKLREHQTEAAKKIFKSFYKGDRGFLLADKTGLGKGLAGSTKIPTPTGFRTMKEIKEGDVVLGRDGRPTTVMEKYNSQAEKFYKITFEDGSTIKADSDHRWLTKNGSEDRSKVKTSPPFSKETQKRLDEYLEQAQSNKLAVTLPEMLEKIGSENRKFLTNLVSNLPSYGVFGKEKLHHPQEVIEALYKYAGLNSPESLKTTQELFEENRLEERDNFIFTTEAVVGEEQNLPLPPYLLGVWLGGGKIDKQYKDELNEIYQTKTIDQNDKNRIPQVYLNGEKEQRLELIRGVMDAAGSVSKDGSGEVSFTHYDKQFFKQLYSLLSSLGWKVRTKEENVYENLGKDSKIFYELSFYPDKQVFTLLNKAEVLSEALQQRNTAKNRGRRILRIEEISKEEEYYCISVDAKDHMYLVTESYLPTHNTLSSLAGITAIAKKEGFDYKNKAKVLIVAPKSVLPQWRNTILSYPVSTTVLRPLIINYEQLNKLLKAPSTARVAKKRSTKNRQTASRGTPTVDWDFVVFDESHKLKNYPQSSMSRAAERVSKIDAVYKRGKTPYVIFSTATPGDTPLNFGIMAGIIAPLLSSAPVSKTITPKKWGEFLNGLNFNLNKTKNGWRWITVPGFDKNSSDPKKRAAYQAQLRKAQALQRKDAQRIGRALLSPGAPFLMRSPTDLAGWPEQQLIPLPIQLNSGQESIYREVWTRFRNWLNLTPARKDPKGALVEMLRYRQKSSLLKVEAVTDFIVDQVESGNQVFVSVEFLETLENLKQALSKKKIMVGEMSGRNVSDREKERIKFQKGETQVILVTPTEGISLHAEEQLPDGTKATSNPRITVVLDVRQNSLENIQLLGRAHRDGKNSVAYIPYLEKTVDERIIDSFTNKFANLKTLTGSSAEDAEALERLFRETAAKVSEPNRLS